MRIGIDIDDTIAKTSEYLIEEGLKFDKSLNNKGFRDKNAYDFRKMFYWNDDECEAFIEYIRKNNLFSEVRIRDDFKDVFDKLSLNNEIYFITFRNERWFNNHVLITEKWLEKNGISYDKLITDSGPKGIVCLNNKIDLFIDDSVKHCLDAVNNGVKTLLMDTIYNRDDNDLNRVNDWYDVLSYLDRG